MLVQYPAEGLQLDTVGRGVAQAQLGARLRVGLEPALWPVVRTADGPFFAQARPLKLQGRKAVADAVQAVL